VKGQKGKRKEIRRKKSQDEGNRTETKKEEFM
jgi:hypothetical protein